MIIRIVFEAGSEKTQETQFLFGGSPSGTCLSSCNAYKIPSNEVKDKVGELIWFWYLDIDILNKYYNGVRSCINGLASYPGVKSVDIVPIIEGFEATLSDEDYTIMKGKLVNYLKDTI